MAQMGLSQRRLMLRVLQYYHGKIYKKINQNHSSHNNFINELTVYLNHVDWSGYVQQMYPGRTHLEYQLVLLWSRTWTVKNFKKKFCCIYKPLLVVEGKTNLISGLLILLSPPVCEGIHRYNSGQINCTQYLPLFINLLFSANVIAFAFSLHVVVMSKLGCIISSP